MSEDYLQPDFYRFNQDSLALVKWIVARNNSAEWVADLGAGCGVIGIELARHLKPKHLQLVEWQPEFHPYLTHNLAKFLPVATQGLITISSYGQWQPPEKFDLIAANPPYYLPGKGEPSSHLQRQICRSFIHENWDELIKAMALSLKPQGRGYLVIKDRSEILTMAEKAIAQFPLSTSLERQNDLILIELKLIG